MQSETRLGHFIQYTMIVVSAIEGIARTHKVPLLGPTAALSLEILHMMEASVVCFSPLILIMKYIE
jgi:hypothetical protein